MISDMECVAVNQDDTLIGGQSRQKWLVSCPEYSVDVMTMTGLFLPAIFWEVKCW